MELSQLTDDHSLAREMSRIMDVTEAHAQVHVGSHIILRALGTEDDVEVDVTLDQPALGDIYLLCSDGLTDAIDDSEIVRIIATAPADPTGTASSTCLHGRFSTTREPPRYRCRPHSSQDDSDIVAGRKTFSSPPSRSAAWPSSASAPGHALPLYPQLNTSKCLFFPNLGLWVLVE